MFDDLRAEEIDRGFLGLVAFTTKDRVNLDKIDDSKNPDPYRSVVADVNRGL